LFEMWLILVIPAALTYTFGKMVGIRGKAGLFSLRSPSCF